MDRFLLCRSEPEKIFTCILEYDESEGSTSRDKHVRVNDLVHVKNGDSWELNKSHFYKLEVAPELVVKCMEEEGFGDVKLERLEWGLVAVVGTKIAR